MVKESSTRETSALKNIGSPAESSKLTIGFFSAKKYDRLYFEKANAKHQYAISFFEAPLCEQTAAAAAEFDVLCVFVNDRLNKTVLNQLSRGKTRYIAFRCAGYNNIDLEAARLMEIQCVRVPAYSPHAVAEHVIALLLTLYRSTHKAYNRVREGNFSLNGLSGEEVFGKTVGIVGTGNIGSVTAQIFSGFGCTLLAHDPRPNLELSAKHNVEYVSFDELCKKSDIISLHCPLTEDSRHIINRQSISVMKPGVTLINTGRGALVDTQAAYEALKSKHLGYFAIDVYEEEASLFFEDLSTDIIMDDLFMRLTTFPNVLITGHQGFFTDPALTKIAEITLGNINELIRTGHSPNEIS